MEHIFMEKNNIIIILLVIIVILAAVLGVMLLNSATAKKPTKLKITSDNEQYEDGELSIQLTDLNNTPISKEIVNITITNGNGEKVVDDVVKTDSNGKARLNLDLNKGKYNVTVSYSGNENYTGNKTTQKLTIKEEVVEATVEPTSSEPQYFSDTGEPISEADYNTLQVYGKSANSMEEWEAQKASLGY